MHSAKLGFSLVALAATAFITVSRVSADSIYNNGSPNHVNGFDISGAFTCADDFKLTSPAKLGSVDFWDMSSGGAAHINSLEWTLYADASGPSGSPLSSGTTTSFTHTATGTPTVSSYVEFHDAFTLPTIPLLAGTYWLAIHANSTNGDVFWETTASNSSASRAQQFNDNTKLWASTGSELAFTVNAAPLPSTLGGGAVLIGLLGAARLRRRAVALRQSH
jgi:hypothetical protein